MWLPSTLYERLPHFWLIGGVAMMSSAVYFGFDYEPSMYYFGGGAICCLWSIAILVARSRRRNQPSAEHSADEASAPAAESD